MGGDSLESVASTPVLIRSDGTVSRDEAGEAQYRHQYVGFVLR